MDFVLGSNLLAAGFQLLVLGHPGIHLKFLDQDLLLSQLLLDGGQLFGSQVHCLSPHQSM